MTAVAVVPAPVDGEGTLGEGDGVGPEEVATVGAGAGIVVGPVLAALPHEHGGATHAHVGAAAPKVNMAGLYPDLSSVRNR